MTELILWSLAVLMIGLGAGFMLGAAWMVWLHEPLRRMGPPLADNTEPIRVTRTWRGAP